MYLTVLLCRAVLCPVSCSTNAPTASYEQQMAAGAKVAARFAGMLPDLGITSASIPTIEARFTWQLAVMQVRQEGLKAF